MSHHAHPWLEDLAGREAVLRCLDADLPRWDRAAARRAFSVYGFDDSTSSEEDVTYTHADSGVMIQYDGDIISIPFGTGDLPQALPDLFATLHAMQWRNAEVYHPAASMPQLLRDMGEAIPANLDFDVRAAKPAESGAPSPEEAAFVAKGRELVASVAATPAEEEEFNALALDALQSMSPVQAPTRLVVAEPAPVRAPIVLLDDDVLPSPVRPVPRAITLDDPDEPQVPVLAAVRAQPAAALVLPEDFEDDAGQGAWRDPAPRAASAAPVVAVSGASPLAVQRAESESSRAPVDSGAVLGRQATAVVVTEPPPAAAAPESEPLVAPQDEPSAEQAAWARGAQSLGDSRAYRLGVSGVCFDDPSDPMSPADVAAVAQRLATAEVVHLWPGLTNQPWRWDVLGEIGQDTPSFAERLAGVLVPSNPLARASVAAQLVEQARAGDRCLRDVIATAMSAERAEAVSYLGGEDLTMARQIIAGELSGLLLPQRGAGFTDCVASDANEAQPANSERFRISALGSDPRARLWVVHLDVTDGTSALALFNLMRKTVDWLAHSTRAQALAEAQLAENTRRAQRAQEEADREQAVLNNKARLQGQMVDLLAQMRAMGIEVPAT